MNFILFSGPPESGKDTGAHIAMKYLWDKVTHVDPIWEKFSFPNKRAFAGMMRLHIDQYGVVEPWESKKNEIISCLGVSYRQWQIDYSEKYMKPLYGNDIFARLLLDRCTRSLHNPIFVVSDCGFQVEIDAIPNDAKVLFFDMHRDGKDYKGDSRGRVEPKNHWTYYQIKNNSDQVFLADCIVSAIGDWLK